MALGIGSSIREYVEEKKKEAEYTGGFTVGSAMQEDLKEEAKKHKDGSMLHPHWGEDIEENNEDEI